MKAVGRRLFSKAVMGVPTVLKGGGGGAPIGLNIGGRGPPPQPAGLLVGDSTKEIARSKIWNAIWKAGRERSAAQSWRETRRHMMGGLDPDLSFLNSMSVARRVQIQIDRQVAHAESQRTWQAKIVSALGGNPEEFE